VVNYGELADRAKALQEPGVHSASERIKRSESDASLFFEHVKTHIFEEMSKANAELAKRRLGGIERVFSPGFEGKLCLTFGASLLCTVDLNAQANGGRVTAIINGPPNGYEISRKEFLFSIHPAKKAAHPEEGAGQSAAYGPDQIAVEIVSGLLQGSFT
jgi:hypothetical protein